MDEDFHSATVSKDAASEMRALQEGATISSLKGGEKLLSVLSGVYDQRQAQVALYLIHKGSDVNYSVPPTNLSPLFAALRFGAPDIVELLLKKGADVNHRNFGGQTPLMTLCTGEILSSRPVQSYDSDYQIFQLLLRHKADVNAQDANGITALMYAASNGNSAAVKVLLAHGADPGKSATVTTSRLFLPNFTPQTGDTALSIAEGKGYTKVVRLLRIALRSRSGA